jgi:Family of unknown function (DUF5317)
MLLVAAFVVCGILIGLALGGSLRNLAEARLRLWPLAVAGFVLQVIPVPSRPGQVDHWVAVGLLLASYGMLLVFVAANIRIPGFPLIAIGFALNALVIGVNRGMPVKDQALRQVAGSRYEQSRQRLLEKGGLKHHLAKPGDVLLPLSDVVGIGGPIRNVYSAGDLLSYAGGAWAIGALTRRPRDPRRGVRETVVRRGRGDDHVGPLPDPADPWGSDPMAAARPDPLASDPTSLPP